MFGLFEPGDLKHTRFYQAIAEAIAVERERLLVMAVFLAHGVTPEQITVKMETDVATIERMMQQQQNALLNHLEA